MADPSTLVATRIEGSRIEAKAEPLSGAVATPVVRTACKLESAYMKRMRLDLSFVKNEDLRKRLSLLVDPRPTPMPREKVQAVAGAINGGGSDYGEELDVVQAVADVIALGYKAENSWVMSLKSLFLLRELLWHSQSLFPQTIFAKITPLPNADIVPSFASNTCGQGIKQRPLVGYVAGMVQFMMQLSLSMDLRDVAIINRKGISVPKADSTSCCSQKCGELLVRCGALLSYLQYLLSARDLPLLAFDNPLSVSILDTVVSDIKRIYTCIWRHLEPLLDERFHKKATIPQTDVNNWVAVIKRFAATAEPVAKFWAQLADLSIGMTEDVQAPHHGFPTDAADKFRDIVARHAQQPEPVRDSSPDVAAESTSQENSGQRDLQNPFGNDTWESGVLTEAVSHNSDTVDDMSTSSFETANEGRYAVGEVLGKGAYGTVYRAFDNDDGQFVAIKELQLESASSASDSSEASVQLREMKSEFDLLKGSSHPHVVSVRSLEVSSDSMRPRIVMEWMPGGSIYGALKLTKRGFKESVVAKYAKQAMLGLQFLHEQGIVHRDIKPGNMLLSATGAVKLSDFGTSRAVSAQSMKTGTVVGTIPYLAPECLRGTYSQGSDVWAMGCSVLEMLTGKVPWSEAAAKDSLALVFMIGNATPPNHHPELPPKCGAMEESPLIPGAGLVCGTGAISSTASDFLQQCFTFDHRERPTARDLLTHPFLAAVQQ